MRVLFASSEIYPLAKTGGLADVSAALPIALAGLGVDVRLVMPGYPEALDSAADVKVVAPCNDGGAAARVLSARLPDSGIPVWLVDCPALFKRSGGLYQNAEGEDWHDNHRRFALLSRVAAKIAAGEIVGDWRADVVHANDWHTGLLPLLLKRGDAAPATLFTIHNLAFQGLFPANALGELRLPEELLGPDGIEFYGRISFLKAGVRYSDRFNTVSPTYAREILTPEFGCGLDGLLNDRAGDLSGILNGIDCAVWNPLSDPYLPARFDAHAMGGKHKCKAELQRALALDVEPETPLVIWASRLAHQKMADTALQTMPSMLSMHDVQFALIGEGEPAFERGFAEMARAHPGRMAVRIGYEEALAHRFYAAGDILLHPSRFEPCGLTPQYAMRYGTVPVVTSVGGLTDTVRDADEPALRAGTATGFSFKEQTAPAMLACLERALAAYAQPVTWRRLQRQAMSQDFGWQASAARYLALYRELAPLAPQVEAEIPLQPGAGETEEIAASPIAAA